MSEKTYNGWTNYETWNVNLWIDNDQSEQSYWQDQAQTAYDGAEAAKSLAKAERAALDLSDHIKDHYETAAQDVLGEQYQASVWADLLGAALSEVNWYEIAQHMIYLRSILAR